MAAAVDKKKQQQQILILLVLAGAAVVVLFVYPGILMKGGKGNPNAQPTAPATPEQPAANAAAGENKGAAGGDNRPFNDKELASTDLPDLVKAFHEWPDGKLPDGLKDPFPTKFAGDASSANPVPTAKPFTITGFFGDQVTMKEFPGEFKAKSEEIEDANKNKYQIKEVDPVAETITLIDLRTGKEIVISK